MISVYQYKSIHPGPHLLILGSVHGDEPCGYQAIIRVLRDFYYSIPVACGTLTLIPAANPAALEQGSHYLQRNLNRLFGQPHKPNVYESYLADLLEPYIEACDVLLDLHSYQSGPDYGAPFAFMDQENESLSCLIKTLNIPNVIIRYHTGNLTPGTTVHYAYRKEKIALTCECGDDRDPHSTSFGYQTIYRVLMHYGLIQDQHFCVLEKYKQNWYALDDVFIKQEEGYFVEDWQHLDPVSPGTVIARYNSGEEIIVDQHGVIIMPTARRSVGDEWFWTGHSL